MGAWRRVEANANAEGSVERGATDKADAPIFLALACRTGQAARVWRDSDLANLGSTKKDSSWTTRRPS